MYVVLSLYILGSSILTVMLRRNSRFYSFMAPLQAFLQWCGLYSFVKTLVAVIRTGELLFFAEVPFVSLAGFIHVILPVLLLTGGFLIWRIGTREFVPEEAVSVQKIFSSMVLSTGVPVIIYIVYNGDFSLFIFLIGYICINLLFYIPAVFNTRFIPGTARISILTILAAAAFAGIVITPLSAFLAWFDLLKEEGAGGLIPLLFAVTGGFFSSVFGGMVYKHRYTGPILGNLLILTFLLSIMHQSTLFMILTFLLLFTGLIYLAYPRLSNKPRQEIQSAAVIMGVAFILALPFATAEDELGSTLVDGTLSPFFRNLTVSMFPDFPFLYSMSGYGYSFNEKRLGGKPTLSERAVFTVTAPPGSTLYLRTKVFDFYNGTGWLQSAGLLDNAAEQDPDQYFINQSQSGSEDGRIGIEVHTDFFNQIPHLLGSYIFSSETKGTDDIKLGDPNLGFILKNPLVKGETLTVSQKPRTSADIEFEREYLTLPAELPDEIRELGIRLGAGLDNDPEKILANIETYLAQNYTYSLEVNYIPREAVDPTWDFLFNSETGYCTHFATAYILFARLNGIPSRYTTGFLVYMPRDNNSSEVTGLSAHAWPEVWVPGKGWTTREATPPMNPDLQEDFLYFGDYLNSQSFTSRQLESILRNRGINFAEAGEESSEGFRWPLAAIIVLILGLIGIAVIFSPRVIQSLPTHDHNLQMKRLMKRIVRYYKLYGVAPPREGGWNAWYDRIQQIKPDYSQAALRVSRIASRHFYGPGEAPERDRKYLRLFIRRGYR